MDRRTTTSGRAADRRSRATRSRHRPPTAARRPGLYLGAAVAGALLVGAGIGTDPAAQADATATEPVSVAQELGLTAGSGPVDVAEELQPLEELAVSRSTREAAEVAAQQAQAAADRAELDRRAAEAEAAAPAAADAEAAEAAAAEAAGAAAAETAARSSAVAGRTTGNAAAPAAGAPAAAAAGVAARISNSAGKVKPHVQAAANTVMGNVPGIRSIGGTRASAADPKGHPSGLALDYMTSPAVGDAVAQYHIAHWDELGVDYIIWQQRMLSSPNGSWKQMENRGSATANHMDHVHVNHRAG
ncbi:hypothetical protein [Modestobacter lapidis]